MLNFESAKYVDPKVQIAPRELPVEEMMKVGNVLQDRFDKSMENETKTQALFRKLKASSNPADHAVADQIMSNYNQRLKDRATNGRYQDMLWQTQQDAMDVAGMYEGLSNRAKQIAEYEKAIDLNTVNSPEIKKLQKEKYRKSIMQSQFDPEKRILQGLDVSAPNIVNAFDYEKHMMDLAGQWKPDTRGSKTVKEVWIPKGAKAPDGSISPGSNYKVLDNRFTEQVKAEDLRNHLEKSALSNEMLQAALKQDREVYGDDIAFQRYHNAINAAIDAKAYIKQLENEHSAEMTVPKTNGQGDGYGEQQNPQPTKIADTRNIDNAASPLSKSVNETLTDYNKNIDVSYENFKSGKSDNAVKNREVISMFTTYLMNKIPELEKSNNDKDKKLLKNINTGAWNTDWKDEGNPGNAFYTAYTKIARGKPETLTSMEYNKIMDLMKDQNISYNYAPKVYNTNDPNYKARNLAEFGTLVLDTNGEYDPLKAINQMNYKAFNNPNGLAIKKTGALEKGENTALGGASSRGWKYLDPITNSVKDLNTLIDELPNATTNLTVSGIPDPSSLMTANENHREGSNTSYFGNGYVVNFIDKNGQERDIIIGNPSEVNTGNAQVANLSRFAKGIHGTETVNLKVGNEEMSFKVRGEGDKVVVSSGKQSRKFTSDEYIQWLKDVIQPNKTN